jgi:enoyl-CoA hydratase/carnithine racemase
VGEHVDTDAVLYEVRDSIGLVTLNRPSRRNAWTAEMEVLLAQILATADADNTVRAVVISGAGGSFCAGRDLDELTAQARGSGPGSGAAGRLSASRLRKPVVAAITGACAGAGLVCAVYCDIRFAATDARITTSFARRGLPAEYGLAVMLPRLVGHGRALDLLMSARVLSGTEAHGIGLVEYLCEPSDVLSAALRYATELSRECSPWALAATKEQIYREFASSLESSLGHAGQLQREAFTRDDVLEGIDSLRGRRPPQFTDPPSPREGKS